MQMLAVMFSDSLTPVLGIFDAMLYIMSAMFQLVFSILDLALALVIW